MVRSIAMRPVATFLQATGVAAEEPEEMARMFVALALFPVVDAIDNRIRLPRSLVILIVYLGLLASVAVIGYVVVPSLVKEVQQVAHDAPRYAVDLRSRT